MKKFIKGRAALATFPLSALSLAISSVVYAQETVEAEAADQQNAVETAEPAKNKPVIASPLEEMLILGRQQSAAQDLVLERMEFDSVVDLLGAEQISRLGDSNVASALKRVPGLTLVDDKFVYVRGLGERYSSSLLNGASVPSPDLTRNVLPLDIFPASVIDSLAVQKGYSANMPAAFGGGNIDIRTKGLPDKFVFTVELSGGLHSTSDEYFDYNGGSDDSLGTDDGTRAVSNQITTALRTYATSLDSLQYDITPQAIRNTSIRAGNPITLDEAQAINSQLATEVYRDLDLTNEDSALQDGGISFSLGNRFDVGNDIELGVLASIDYDTSIRTDERTSRDLLDSTEEFAVETRSTQNVSITGTLNIGLNWNDEHELASKNLFLRNTDDEASSTDEYNSTAPFSGGNGIRIFETRYEERELEVFQFSGNHKLGEYTRDLLGIGDNFLNDLEFNWFYSDSEATTTIPGESSIEASFARNLDSGEVTGVRIASSQRMLNTRYTDLKDEVESSGFDIKLPIEAGDWVIELSGGGKFDTKARTYEQLDLSVGTTANIDPILTSSISETLSDENLTNEDYNFTLSYLSGNSRSYLAATKTDAAFGQLDVEWNETWTVVLGARYEEYKQFSAPWQPYRQNGSQLQLNIDDAVDSESAPEGTFADNEVYPSLALTYATQDFWAEDFNLRFNVSETVVRPDLREVSASSYQDPLTDIIVNGNPDVIPSEITNFDLRGEWYFVSGDSLSVSLFFKDIKNPIEYFQGLGAESSISATIENADSGETKGIEIEWLKNLAFVGDWGSQFFVNGNVTFADSEINTGGNIAFATNDVRPLTGASEYVANVQFGYDSDDGKHAATLVYNVFGERIFTAGINEAGDAYEQPFNSLDFTYSFFLNEQFTIKFRTKNLLDESLLITQENNTGRTVDIFEESVGQSYSLSLRYDF